VSLSCSPALNYGTLRRVFMHLALVKLDLILFAVAINVSIVMCSAIDELNLCLCVRQKVGVQLGGDLCN
jgi:hypothetical protein